MDDRIIAEVPLQDEHGRPTEAAWFQKFDELDLAFAHRKFNDIVRMKLDSEVRKIKALAEQHGIGAAAFVELFNRWAEQRRRNPQSFAPMKGF